MLADREVDNYPLAYFKYTYPPMGEKDFDYCVKQAPAAALAFTEAFIRKTDEVL